MGLSFEHQSINLDDERCVRNGIFGLLRNNLRAVMTGNTKTLICR